jgi:transcriptional regulator
MSGPSGPDVAAMYTPRAFAETRRAPLHAAMHAHPLATVAYVDDGRPDVCHVPLELDADAGEHGTLRGHVARPNPLWRAADGGEVLLVFHGPDAYVSPSHYASKVEHGRVVPTWNYLVVHARGRLRAVSDAPWLRALVGRLTDRHEAERAAPWAVDDAPDDYVEGMLGAIVGIEIPIDELAGAFKLSQNKAGADLAGVRAGLAAEAPALARAMETDDG